MWNRWVKYELEDIAYILSEAINELDVLERDTEANLFSSHSTDKNLKKIL